MKVLILLAAIVGIAMCRPHVGELALPNTDVETPIVDDDDDSSSVESAAANKLSLSAGLNDDGEDSVNDIEEKPEIPDVSGLNLEGSKDASQTSVGSTSTRFDSTPLSQPQQDFTILSSAMYIPPDQPTPAATVPAVPLNDPVPSGITTVKKEDGYHYGAPAVKFAETSGSAVQSDYVAQPAAKTGFTSTSQFTSVSAPAPAQQQNYVAQQAANTGFTQYTSNVQPAANNGFTSSSQYTSVSAPAPAQQQNYVAQSQYTSVAQPAANNGFTSTSQFASVSAPAPARFPSQATEQVVGNVEIVQQEMRELAPIVEYVMQNYQAQPQQTQFQQIQPFQQSQPQPQFYQAAQQQDYLPPHNDYLPPMAY